jgi:hypothetical protein
MQTELVPVDGASLWTLTSYPGNAGPALERATGPGLEVPATVRQAVRRFIGSIATTAPS